MAEALDYFSSTKKYFSFPQAHSSVQELVYYFIEYLLYVKYMWVEGKFGEGETKMTNTYFQHLDPSIFTI